MFSLTLSRSLDGGQMDGLPLLGLPTKRSAERRLSKSADDILRSIAGMLRELIGEVIEKRSAKEFEAAVEAAFPRYVSLVLSFSRIVGTVVPERDLARISAESFSEMEAEFRAAGLQSFGSSVRERVLFTVWTLRKTADLLEVLVSGSGPALERQRSRDEEFVTKFLFHALFARFNIDCLFIAMREEKPIYPEVLPLVEDGLRHAVNAYAWIKQAVDLRFPSDEEAGVPAYWTQDDEALLSESMLEIEGDTLPDGPG